MLLFAHLNVRCGSGVVEGGSEDVDEGGAHDLSDGNVGGGGASEEEEKQIVFKDGYKGSFKVE